MRALCSTVSYNLNIEPTVCTALIISHAIHRAIRGRMLTVSGRRDKRRKRTTKKKYDKRVRLNAATCSI